MPIGEFGAAPVAADAGQDFVSTPLYWMYEAGHAALIERMMKLAARCPADWRSGA